MYEAFDHFAAEFGLIGRSETLIIVAGIGRSGRCDIACSELPSDNRPLRSVLDIRRSVVARRLEVHDVGSRDIALG